MLIGLVKFIHLIFALSLLGSILYCLILVSSNKFIPAYLPRRDKINRTNKLAISFCVLAALTGTLLVYPKHYTFHTPWIEAAYLLVLALASTLSGLLFLTRNQKIRWLWQLTYVILITLLVFVIHDAVTKSTFLF